MAVACGMYAMGKGRTHLMQCHTPSSEPITALGTLWEKPPIRLSCTFMSMQVCRCPTLTTRWCMVSLEDDDHRMYAWAIYMLWG